LQIGTVYQRLQQTRGALARLAPLRQPTNIEDIPGASPLTQPQGEITYQDVGVQIDGKWLLRDVSLHISAGQVVAIVGPTGCGKTLLVSLLARVLDPSEGEIRVDGTNVMDLKLDDLRKAIAYVPESTFLFSQELHRNIRMGRADISADELHEAINTSRMSNDLPQLPNGLDTLVGEKGVMLSGGQKQRVAIARAIVRDPAILILDDALSSVDMHTAADILNDLRGVLRTRTSIIIAHRIATVKDADHIIVMTDGRVVEEGKHDELVKRDGVYAQMVERELKEEAFENV
jgi:ATP-binding cassette subfamily B protein